MFLSKLSTVSKKISLALSIGTFLLALGSVSSIAHAGVEKNDDGSVRETTGDQKKEEKTKKKPKKAWKDMTEDEKRKQRQDDYEP